MGHVDPCLGYIPGVRYACCGHELVDEWAEWDPNESLGEAYMCAFPSEFDAAFDKFKTLVQSRLGSGVFVVTRTEPLTQRPLPAGLPPRGTCADTMVCAYVHRVRGEVELTIDAWQVWAL